MASAATIIASRATQLATVATDQAALTALPEFLAANGTSVANVTDNNEIYVRPFRLAGADRDNFVAWIKTAYP